MRRQCTGPFPYPGQTRQTDHPHTGSEFERNRDASYRPESELESGYVKITFHGAATVFARDAADCIWRPRDTVPLESRLPLNLSCASSSISPFWHRLV